MMSGDTNSEGLKSWLYVYMYSKNKLETTLHCMLLKSFVTEALSHRIKSIAMRCYADLSNKSLFM